MAFCAAACAVEILLPFFGVAGLEIFGLHGAPAAGVGIHLGLLIVNECNDGGQVGVREIEGRHAFVDSPRTNYGTDFVSADIFFHEFGTREVRPGFATASISSVAESTLRGEERLSLLHLLRGGSLLRGGLRCRRRSLRRRGRSLQCRLR